MILMSVLAACVPWGSPGLIAFVVSCAWFASPTLAAMTVLLMVNVGCIKKADIKVEQLALSATGHSVSDQLLAVLLTSGSPGPDYVCAQIITKRLVHMPVLCPVLALGRATQADAPLWVQQSAKCTALILLVTIPCIFQAACLPYAAVPASMAAKGLLIAAQENKTVQWAFHLLPWLASETVTVVVAQLLKADLAKGWAAWLQALVTTGIGLGALLVSGIYSEEVPPIPFMP